MNSLTTIRHVKRHKYYTHKASSKNEIINILERINYVIFNLHMAKDKITDKTHFRITNNISTMIVYISVDLEFMKVINQ